MIRRLLVLSLAMAACGGGDSNPTTDGPAGSDAPQQQSNITVVTPCAGESATVMATNASNSYMPAATTISVGQIVKFEMPSFHNVVPKTTADDPGLMVNFNETKCLQFDAAGTYNFKCQPHGFTGTITVQ